MIHCVSFSDRCEPGSWSTFAVQVTENRADEGEADARIRSAEHVIKSRSVANHADKLTFGGHRRSLIPRLIMPSRQRACHCQRLHPRHRDRATRLASRASLNADALLKSGVGSIADNREAREVTDGHDFSGIKLDDRVVQIIVRRRNCSNVAACAFADDVGSCSTACRRCQPDERACVVVTDGGESAVGAVDDDARATTENSSVGGSDTTHQACRCGDRGENRRYRTVHDADATARSQRSIGN
jgi:hypothetical protein